MKYLSKHTRRIIIPILMIIAQIESGNDTTQIGDNGRAIGHLQIHKECVEDVNHWFGTKYCHEDMEDRAKAEDVFFKYITLGEDRFVKKHLRYPDEKDIVNFWNFGIYQKPTNSVYYGKYQQEKKRQKSQLRRLGNIGG